MIHIASKRRMVEIFSVNGSVASVQNRNGILYTCAAKVCLADSFGRSIIGYVINEDNDKFIVLLENDTVVDITWPIFDVRCGCYVFDFVEIENTA